jgi:post-segregation antitoxin (ccd killing protein)
VKNPLRQYRPVPMGMGGSTRRQRMARLALTEEEEARLEAVKHRINISAVISRALMDEVERLETWRNPTPY